MPLLFYQHCRRSKYLREFSIILKFKEDAQSVIRYGTRMSAKSPDQPGSGGAGVVERQEDRRGGKKGNDGRSAIPRQNKFEGRCDARKGHIFDWRTSL